MHQARWALEDEAIQLTPEQLCMGHTRPEICHPEAAQEIRFHPSAFFNTHPQS